MKTRAKFVCTSIGKGIVQKPGEKMDTIADSVVMVPVYSEENREWSKYTPSGELKLYISNPALEGAFQVGKEYYLDITEAG
jgi:hypothetical protein